MSWNVERTGEIYPQLERTGDSSGALLPTPGSSLPTSLQDDHCELPKSEVQAKVNRSSCLHKVSELLRSFGKTLGGCIGAVGAVIGGGLSGSSLGLWYGATVLAGLLGTIPGGLIGFTVGAFKDDALGGMSKGSKIGYNIASSIVGVASAFPLAIPYLVGSSLLKGSEKLLTHTIGITPDAQKLINLALYVERHVNWQEVWANQRVFE